MTQSVVQSVYRKRIDLIQTIISLYFKHLKIRIIKTGIHVYNNTYSRLCLCKPLLDFSQSFTIIYTDSIIFDRFYAFHLVEK